MLNQSLVNFLNSDIRPRYLYEVASELYQTMGHQVFIF